LSRPKYQKPGSLAAWKLGSLATTLTTEAEKFGGLATTKNDKSIENIIQFPCFYFGYSI